MRGKTEWMNAFKHTETAKAKGRLFLVDLVFNQQNYSHVYLIDNMHTHARADLWNKDFCWL